MTDGVPPLHLLLGTVPLSQAAFSGSPAASVGAGACGAPGSRTFEKSWGRLFECAVHQQLKKACPAAAASICCIENSSLARMHPLVASISACLCAPPQAGNGCATGKADLRPGGKCTPRGRRFRGLLPSASTIPPIGSAFEADGTYAQQIPKGKLTPLRTFRGSCFSSFCVIRTYFGNTIEGRRCVGSTQEYLPLCE